MILTSTRTRTTVATDETSHVVRQRMRQATEAAVSGDLRGLHRQDHTEPGEDGVYVRADNAAAVAGRNTSAELPCNQDRLVSGERARGTRKDEGTMSRSGYTDDYDDIGLPTAQTAGSP